jgi:hypothetical protein
MVNSESPPDLLYHRQQTIVGILIDQNDLDIISTLAEDGAEERGDLCCPSTSCDYQAESDHVFAFPFVASRKKFLE